MRSFAGIIAITALAGTASADIVAATYTGGGQPANYNVAVGWQFTVSGSDILVTCLGILDKLPQGLIDEHDIGIFDAETGEAIVTSVIPAGNGGTFMDGSRFYEIDPVQLDAGKSYYIVANNFQNDIAVTGDDQISFATEVAFQGQAIGASNDIFDAVGLTGAGPDGILGPNFSYEIIPAPAAGMLMGMGLVFAGRRRR